MAVLPTRSHIYIWDSGDTAPENPVCKRDPLDVKYPHECYDSNCNYKLTFKELLGRNASIKIDGCVLNFYNYKDYKHLKKLWKSKYVQFLCCQCYDNMIHCGKDKI